MIIISRYSGKFDLADELEIHNYTLEELQNNVRIYIGNSQKPLHIEKMSDLIPYYPYIIGSYCSTNIDGERKSVMYITSESFVDREERERLEYYLEYAIKVYNRCKRKKIEFNVEDVVKDLCFLDFNRDQITELANRVKENGKKATIDGIYLTMHEIYRQNLVEEMIENGLNPSDYGYERFVGEKYE